MEHLLVESKHSVKELAEYINKNKRFDDKTRFILLIDKINILLSTVKVAALVGEQNSIDTVKSDLVKLESETHTQTSNKQSQITDKKTNITTLEQSIVDIEKAFELIQKEFEDLQDYLSNDGRDYVKYNMKTINGQSGQTGQYGQNGQNEQTGKREKTHMSVAI